MSDALVDRVVLVDSYGWSTPIPGRVDGRRDYHVARRGDVISVSAAEAARGDALGGLAEVTVARDGSIDEAARAAVDAAAQASVTPSAEPDERLKAMNMAELTAYMGQNPFEVERVLALEEQRGAKSRKGIVEAGQRILLERAAAGSVAPGGQGQPVHPSLEDVEATAAAARAEAAELDARQSGGTGAAPAIPA